MHVDVINALDLLWIHTNMEMSMSKVFSVSHTVCITITVFVWVFIGTEILQSTADWKGEVNSFVHRAISFQVSELDCD